MMEVLDAIQARHSIRKFTDDPVDSGDLIAMLRAATLAPNPSNRQQWRFIAVQNKDVLRRMREAIQARAQEMISFAEDHGMMEEARELRGRLTNSSFFETAPATIAACERIDPPDARARVFQAQGLSDAEIDNRLPSRAIQGIGAAIENLMLVAVSLGYGTCWMTSPMIAVHELEKILQVEPPFRLVALVPIGRPAQSSAGRPRKLLEEVVAIID